MTNFKVLDFQLAQAKEFARKEPSKSIRCDVLVVGGGMGGVAAVLSALKQNKDGRRLKICLSEETKWLGGQMTSQAVSALDENWLVETTGAAKDYIDFRNETRQFYLKSASAAGKSQKYFNAGNNWVSRISFEPTVAVDILQEKLDPYIENGDLSVFLRHLAVEADTEKSNGKTKVKRLLLVNLDTGEFVEILPEVVLDATECGDLLPLSKLNYVFGQESKEDTGEPHAPVQANWQNVQDFVYPFVLELREGENHTIAKPEQYEELRDFRKFSLLGFKMFENAERVSPEGNKQELLPFWSYRRLIAKENFLPEVYANDLSMINWETNDTRDMNFIDKSPDEAAQLLNKAKNISLSFLYWLQTEAPHDNGNGRGFPQFMLRKDLLGSIDGLSLFPYIRESRRIKALTTVTETDIGSQFFTGKRARNFCDSVGIGHYPIDIHGRQEKGAAQQTRPFQIPYGALVPADADNVLAACKNIGTTHITNGAYRLHPIEWAIGTACGAAARLAIEQNKKIWQIHDNQPLLQELQKALLEEGNPIFWFEDIEPQNPDFVTIQIQSTWQELQPNADTLAFMANKIS